MTARLQHITIRDELPRVRMLAARRANKERRAQTWATVKRWADRLVTAALFVGSAWALWAILGRM